MASLPDPSATLTGADLAAFRHMGEVRAHSSGRPQLGDVYVRMFNNPGVAEKVGALGEHLRFAGVLPDDVRELVILRFAARRRLGYIWSHHQHPARLAGLDQATVDSVTAGEDPVALPDATRAALAAVDAVVADHPIPADVQARVVAVHGDAGIVEVVALCGLYATMGYMVEAFEIPLDPGLPPAPF